MTANRSIVVDHRSGRQRRLSLAGDQVRTVQDAERRGPRGDEASADYVRARSRQPAALPQMRQGGPASIRDSATVDVAAAPPSNRILTDVQPLFHHDQPSRDQRAIPRLNRHVGNLAPMPGVFPDYKAPIVRNGAKGRELASARWGMPSSSKALMDATKKRAEKLQAKGKAVDISRNCSDWSRTAARPTSAM